ncbi:MAG: C10 family peptidase [Chitinispirillia bacterium]|nr:C10 family peptidase [Chitinispirillia bacterium]MCL2241941.1 C10 family peptidase [Chitinispirillia bacterium]
MDKRAVILAFALIMTVFGGGYLYAQEDDDDIADLTEVGVYYEPSDEEIASMPAGQPNPQTVVGPLLKTKWGMGEPYKSMMPGRSRSGCVGTAIAQIMYYHKHPARGSGQSKPYTSKGVDVPSVNFDEVKFDWDNMLTTYTKKNPGTEKQRDAVATLFKYMAIGIGMHFGPDGTGGTVTGSRCRKGLITFFGYDKSIQTLSRSYYTDDAWKAIIKAQLDAGLPVYYFGRDKMSTTNHAFVIDGYDNADKFHVNWGWNGAGNGWYSLDALSPGKADFSYGSALSIIKPDQGGVGSNEMALVAFTAGKPSVTQNELFQVTANIISLGFFSGGHVGTALVNSKNEIVEIIGMDRYATRNFGALASGVRRSATINCYVPEAVKAGQYRLRIVIKPQGGDWKLVELSEIRNGVPNAVDLTVTPHTGANPGGGYGLLLEKFSVTDDKMHVYHGEKFSVDVRTRKIGEKAFPGGQLGVALADSNGDIVGVIKEINWNALNPGASYRGLTIKNCSVPNTVTPGQYKLMIVTKTAGGEWRFATLSRNDTPNSIDFQVLEPGAPIPPPSAPAGKPAEKEAAPVVAPVNQQAASEPVTGTGNLTVIPSPVIRTSSRTATFYWHGKRVSATALPIYDSSDKLVSGVEINDGATSGADGAKRRVGVWDLKDLDGRPVPAGRYTVRGVLKAQDDGGAVRVEFAVDVR